MIIFQGNIEATPESYSKMAAVGKATIDQLTHLFQGINCPQHPFHHVHAQVSVAENIGTSVTLANSCCDRFTDLFDTTITKAGIVLDDLHAAIVSA